MAELKVIIKEIPIGKISENIGQIPDVPENPRRISEEAFELLKRFASHVDEADRLDEYHLLPIATEIFGTNSCQGDSC